MSPRTRRPPSDPIFAAEMIELEKQRHEAWLAEHTQPPTTSGAPLPPLFPAIQHRHGDDCLDPERWRIVVGMVYQGWCRQTRQWANLRTVERTEYDAAYQAGRVAQAIDP